MGEPPSPAMSPMRRLHHKPIDFKPQPRDHESNEGFDGWRVLRTTSDQLKPRQRPVCVDTSVSNYHFDRRNLSPSSEVARRQLEARQCALDGLSDNIKNHYLHGGAYSAEAERTDMSSVLALPRQLTKAFSQPQGLALP